METEQPREQAHSFSSAAGADMESNPQFEQRFPLKFPRRPLPERWKEWFELIDR